MALTDMLRIFIFVVTRSLRQMILPTNELRRKRGVGRKPDGGAALMRHQLGAINERVGRRQCSYSGQPIHAVGAIAFRCSPDGCVSPNFERSSVQNARNAANPTDRHRAAPAEMSGFSQTFTSPSKGEEAAP